MTHKNESIALAIRNDPEWRQVFCAALTGVAAGWKSEGSAEHADDPFDMVMFAASIADEALPRNTKGVTK